MCHCLSNTHNTACIQIPTENSESSVSLSLQHPRHNVRSNTHWNQWVLCVTVFPTPTIQCVFKCPLKTVSPMCHPLSNAHNTACVQTYTEKSESSVSYLSNTQNTTCSYNHWQEWVICVTISLTPTTLCVPAHSVLSHYVQTFTDKCETYQHIAPIYFVHVSFQHPQHCVCVSQNTHQQVWDTQHRHLLTLCYVTMSKHPSTSVRHTNT